MIVVTSLNIYPIKSCQGIPVDEAALDTFGLIGDRRYIVVDEARRLLTQRGLPRLAHVAARLGSQELTLSAPDAPVFSLPLRPENGAEAFEVAIWNDTVSGVDMGNGAADWLTHVLNRPARLVAMSEGFARPIRKTTAAAGDQAAFTDAYPLLVISEESLGDLNRRLDEPLPMNRFRPNLVVRGCPAFAEDTWKRIRIGDVVLRAGGPCGRCIMTTTDQETLDRGKEPLKTLALYRRGADGDVNFGQNYIHETKSGSLRVGMPVEVLE